MYVSFWSPYIMAKQHENKKIKKFLIKNNYGKFAPSNVKIKTL